MTDARLRQAGGEVADNAVGYEAAWLQGGGRGVGDGGGVG